MADRPCPVTALREHSKPKNLKLVGRVAFAYTTRALCDLDLHDDLVRDDVGKLGIRSFSCSDQRISDLTSELPRHCPRRTGQSSSSRPSCSGTDRALGKPHLWNIQLRFARISKFDSTSSGLTQSPDRDGWEATTPVRFERRGRQLLQQCSSCLGHHLTASRAQTTRYQDPGRRGRDPTFRRTSCIVDHIVDAMCEQRPVDAARRSIKWS